MSRAWLDDRSSTHVVVSVRRYAVVEFDGESRRVRRVVSMFDSAVTADLFAVEQGWADYAVGPASIVTSLRD